MTHMRSSGFSLLPALAILAALPTAQAAAKECSVKPLDAYNYAVQKGWGFSCVTNGMGGGSLQPAPPAELRCVKKTPPIVPPRKLLQVVFFKKGGANRSNGKLNKGWRVKSFTATPQHVQGGPGKGTSAVWFKVDLKTANHTYTAKLKTLKLLSPGRTPCSAWKQAFD